MPRVRPYLYATNSRPSIEEPSAKGCKGGSGCAATKIKSGRKRDMEMLDLSALRLITIKNNFLRKLYLMVGGVCACANRFGFFNGRNRTKRKASALP